jgi:hypothetical protein
MIVEYRWQFDRVNHDTVIQGHQNSNMDDIFDRSNNHIRSSDKRCDQLDIVRVVVHNHYHPRILSTWCRCCQSFSRMLHRSMNHVSSWRQWLWPRTIYYHTFIHVAKWHVVCVLYCWSFFSLTCTHDVEDTCRAELRRIYILLMGTRALVSHYSSVNRTT